MYVENKKKCQFTLKINAFDLHIGGNTAHYTYVTTVRPRPRVYCKYSAKIK